MPCAERRRRAAPLALIFLAATALGGWAGAAEGGRAEAAGEPRPRTLIVVIWERRAPRAEDVRFQYGLVQRGNREALLSALFDGPRPLVEDPASTILAIYPEGVEGVDRMSGGFARIRTSSAPRIWEAELPAMVATPETPGLVRGIFRHPVPERGELDRAIRRYVTYPLVGLPPWSAADTAVDESTQRSADPGAARAVSSPPLVTAWALGDAARRAGAQRELLSPVYVIWVHAGDRNYRMTNPRQRILADYGPACRDLYADTLQLYSLSPDETRGVDGELADGNVVVRRVLPRRAVREPPQAAILAGRAPAAVRWEESDIWANPLWGRAAARRSFRRSLARLQWPSWEFRLATPRYSIANGRFLLVQAMLAESIGADGKVPGGLQALVERAHPVTGTSWHADDDVVAETLLEAAPEDGVPAYLAADALRIPVTHRTQPAPVSIHLSSLHPFYGWAGAGVALGAIAALGIHIRRRLAPRSLVPALDFGPDDVDEVVVEGPETTHRTPASLALLDPSGFRARRVAIPVVVELTSPLAGAPVSRRRPLHTFVADGGKQELQLGQRVQVSLHPTRRLGDGERKALDVRFEAAALDFQRLTAAEEVRGAYTVAVELAQPSRGYRPFRVELARRFAFVVQAVEPRFKIELVPAERVGRLGFFGDPGADPESLRRYFGQLIVSNPPPPEGVALDITVAVARTTCSVEGGNHAQLRTAIHRHRSEQREPRVTWAADDRGVQLKNGGSAAYDLYLWLPAGEAWSRGQSWTICFSTEVAVSWQGVSAQRVQRTAKAQWLPVDELSFACLDLGTSTTRLLVQGEDLDQFGYLRFPTQLQPRSDAVEDLPSAAWIDMGRRSVRFGAEAVRHALSEEDTSGAGGAGFYPSLKELMLSHPGRPIGGDGPAGGARYRQAAAKIELYVERLLTDLYRPAVHAETAGGGEADLVNPYTPAVPVVHRGPRHVLVGTVPNEAPPALIEAYRRAVERSGLFRRFLVVREAEAAAFGYLREEGIRQPLGDRTLRLVVVDVGAGSTDVALMEATAGSLLVLARAGVQVAGNRVDEAVLEALPAAMGLDPALLFGTQPGSDPRSEWRSGTQMRAQAERLKIALSRGDGGVTFEAAYTVRDVDAATLRAIGNSVPYRRALAEVIEEPLWMLLGRIDNPAQVERPDVLLLTGRGALIHGVRQQVEATLAQAGIRPRQVVCDAGKAGTFLKAAVTLGARAFGLGPWPVMRLSDQTFADRLILVAVTAEGPRYLEALPPNQPFDAAGVLTRTVPVPFPEWSEAMLVQTFLRGDEAFGEPLRLTPARLGSILQGVPIDSLRTGAYSPIRGALPVRSARQPKAPLELTVRATGEVAWRLDGVDSRGVQ